MEVVCYSLFGYGMACNDGEAEGTELEYIVLLLGENQQKTFVTKKKKKKLSKGHDVGWSSIGAAFGQKRLITGTFFL